MPVPAHEILVYHLTSNHVPAIPAAFADVAAAAIEAIEAGAPERLISYGDGRTANGRHADTAADIAESMHLWSMIDDPDADEAA